MKKVCHISTVHGALDDRIFYKECLSLGENYEVHLIVSYPNNDFIQGVQIHALPLKRGLFYRLFVKQVLAFFYSFQIKASIYHLHDPELIPLGMILKIFRKKVIFDMHEFSYFHILGKTWAPRPVIFLLAKVYAFIEGIAFKYFFDRIFLVVDEGKYYEYIQSRYAKVIHKFTVLRNFSILELIKAQKPKVERSTSPFVVVYAGGLSPVRGIYEIIQALEKLPEVELWLLGPWETEKYKNQCATLPAFSRVKYYGVVPMEQVYPYLKSAHVGIANLYPLENYLTSLPIKAFEYMACGLPMIMSDFPYWQKMFNACSLFVDPQSIEDIAQAIEKLKNAPTLCNKLGQEGQRLVQTKYSWEAESKKLIQVYAHLLHKK